MVIKILIACKVESFFDVGAGFGADFEIGEIGLLNFLSDLFLGDFSFFFQVFFIAEDDDNGLFFFIVLAEVYPLIQIVKGLRVSYYHQKY